MDWFSSVYWTGKRTIEGTFYFIFWRTWGWHERHVDNNEFSFMWGFIGGLSRSEMPFNEWWSWFMSTVKTCKEEDWVRKRNFKVFEDVCPAGIYMLWFQPRLWVKNNPGILMWIWVFLKWWGGRYCLQVMVRTWNFNRESRNYVREVWKWKNMREREHVEEVLPSFL